MFEWTFFHFNYQLIRNSGSSFNSSSTLFHGLVVSSFCSKLFLFIYLLCALFISQIGRKSMYVAWMVNYRVRKKRFARVWIFSSFFSSVENFPVISIFFPLNVVVSFVVFHFPRKLKVTCVSIYTFERMVCYLTDPYFGYLNLNNAKKGLSNPLSLPTIYIRISVFVFVCVCMCWCAYTWFH